MHCTNCDMFSTDNTVCSHCGVRLPESVFKEPATTAHASSGGRSFVFLSLAVVLVAVGWWLFRGGSAIPGYMNEGPVILSQEVRPGQTNIVDMYSEYCPPCRQIAPYLEQLDEARDDIHVVKIDINRPEIKGIDWQGPVAKQFRLRSIPHFILVGPDGNLIAEGKPAYKKVVQMLEDTLK